jgi:uroporphyrinogen decarboxylase
MFLRKPVDRIPVFESFWNDTRDVWASQGHIRKDEDLVLHFGHDMDSHWAFNYVADLDAKEIVVEETEETKLVKNGNGATLRWHKLHSSTPEHVDFDVKDRTLWDERFKALLTPDRRRINFDGYRSVKEKCRVNNLFFAWAGINVFEQMHPLCGHEYMLMGMALDPDWVKDMVMTYARLNIDLMEILFSEAGLPDGVWFYEDMGFKNKPFMSPDMYREIIQPGHKLTIDYAKSKGLPVIMHSCGFVEPLIPGIIEAGVDCLQVIEVKAGMDPLRIHKTYGDRLSLMGGIDVRVLYTNDRKQIDAELETKIPVLKQGYGYCLHSDHSIPNTVNYDTYKYFVEKGLALGRY